MKLTLQVLLVSDSWRVLYGRSAFSVRQEMCGGYSVFIPCRVQIEYADLNSQYGQLVSR